MSLYDAREKDAVRKNLQIAVPCWLRLNPLSKKMRVGTIFAAEKE
jgi:hypothetical protein